MQVSAYEGFWLTAGTSTGDCRMNMTRMGTRYSPDLAGMKSRKSGWRHGVKVGQVSREF